MSMLLVPICMYWVAATSVGWSWLPHAQALVRSRTGSGLVPDTFHLVGADTPLAGWCGEGAVDLVRRLVPAIILRLEKRPAPGGTGLDDATC
jgi:hypothetical protein